MSRASFTLNSQSIWDPHLQYCCLVALQWMGGMKLCAVAPSSPQLGPFLKMFEFWKILMWGFIVEKRCIWNVRKCDKTQTFQNIIMPPKSDYWKYFLVQGNRHIGCLSNIRMSQAKCVSRPWGQARTKKEDK